MHRTNLLLLLMALLAVARSARADDAAEARALFDTAKADAKAGDCSAAVPKFSKSYQLDPKPGTLRNVGYCEEQLGRVASALRHFRELIEKFPASDHVEYAKERVRALDPRVPTLIIRLAPAVPEGTTVKLDGDEVAPGDLERALAVDPGEHEIEVSAPGREPASYDVMLEEGKRIEKEVEPGESGERGVEQAVAASNAERLSASGRRTAGYVALGVGVAALAGFAIAEAKWASDCHDKMCDRNEVDIGARRAVSGMLFGVAVVGAGLGAYLVLSDRSKEAERATIVRAEVASGGGSLTLWREF